MKFGTQLINALHPEWRFYYLDYDELKNLLKAGTTNGEFSEKHEAIFVEALERELEKVSSFCRIKADELSRRVQHCETSVDAVIKNSTDENTEIDGDRFQLVEEEISRITTEVGELSKFVRLNYSGFLKILKKHDKHTSYVLKTMFMVRLNAKPFYKQNFDSMIIRLSGIYDTLRTGGKRSATAPPSGPSQSFVRRTTKYWVHPDNVTEVKIHILKNLPVLVFSNKGSKEADPAISSIYFDNDSFDLYLGRLEKHEGAEAVRLRWYGNMDQTEVFVERKTHREDWTGESSVKARFSIKEKYVNSFLKGDYTMDHTIEKQRERGLKSEKELDELHTLSSQVQQSVGVMGLKPMVRTFYNRTAFQLPGDARVRISLDTELTMIREDNYGRPRSGDNWRRMDAGTIAPFTHLAEEDVCAFPYAVLEVKLQTQHGTEAPQWVNDLIKSHLVEEVPKFSKFIHGVATLLENRVSLLPFWLPQMDKDIRKAAPVRPVSTSAFIETRPKRSKSNLKSGSDTSGEDRIDILVDNTGSLRRGSRSGGVQHEDDDEEDENAPLLGSRSRAVPKQNAAVSWLTGMGMGSIFEAPPSVTSNGIPTRHLQKRIALPVRVEPKVFFANERTFLSWLHFCIVLGGLALGLLNFGDAVGQISGVLFTIVSMIFMIYSLFLFQWRAHKIRTRDSGPYDDRFGPTVLVFSLFFAIIINFYLKFSQK
ncbi:hypothetical protein BASA50_011347 [Batrachochytrium salamandrivorans]|uniref:SPX domain-containing protein n=1 Tax=Batrachochytrium salamandrivorans TaxID=1357716 RepID=A0ABQ8EWY5_9FUNG|nr:hypothetical protein BASA50_011347 [Batrachochytrium salamandrivorans]